MASVVAPDDKGAQSLGSVASLAGLESWLCHYLTSPGVGIFTYRGGMIIQPTSQGC